MNIILWVALGVALVAAVAFLLRRTPAARNADSIAAPAEPAVAAPPAAAAAPVRFMAPASPQLRVNALALEDPRVADAQYSPDPVAMQLLMGAGQEFARIGWTEPALPLLATLQLVAIGLYLLPPTAVLGAVLLTGYLGGAIASYVRIGEFYPPLVPLTTALLTWLGIFLREERLRVLLPFRRAGR